MSAAVDRFSAKSVTTAALIPPALMFFGFFAVRSAQSLELVLLAFLCSLVVSLPLLLRRRGQLIEPIFLISILVFFGVSVRLVLVSTLGADSALVRDKLLNGEPLDVLFGGALAMFAALAALSLGYIANPSPLPIDRTFLVRRPLWSPSRTRVAIFGITAIGLVGLVLLTRTYGFDELSTKRFNSLEGGAQQRTSAVGFVFFRMALLLRFGLYLLIIFRRQVAGRFRFLVTVLFLGSMFVPVYVNNRAGVALIVIDLLLIGYFGSGRFRSGQVVRGTVFGGVLAIALLSARTTRDSTLESTIFSRDLLDVSKTAQIMELEPGVLNGQTVVGWMAAPLPIEVEAADTWANLGRYVWTNAYGRPGQNGVPAGFVGEMYLNFGWIAILVGSFLFGFLLRKLFVTFRPHLNIPGVALLYALALPRLTIFVLSNDVGTGVLKTLGDILPLLGLLWFIGRRDLSAPPAQANESELAL